ncbi:MAG: TetR/AcrR family transcriptional regulator [Nocardioides sp.]|uniref:TetR/AcrR family transcriptional regulator n=1 Tax=Nocardioides sp. TaxID=35761 RepID=UPI0039E2B703
MASDRRRLTPEERREQLLDLGVRLLAERSLEEISIDVLAAEAGVSRGLLYHYFGDKSAFREAVVRRAAADLVEQTAPPSVGDPVERLRHSVTAYVDFVDANWAGYRSLLRGAASDPALKAVYDEAFGQLGERVFSADTGLIPDTPAARLVVRGWQAMTEQLVLAWKSGESEVSRGQLLDLLVDALPALAVTLPAE